MAETLVLYCMCYCSRVRWCLFSCSAQVPHTLRNCWNCCLLSHVLLQVDWSTQLTSDFGFLKYRGLATNIVFCRLCLLYCSAVLRTDIEYWSTWSVAWSCLRKWSHSVFCEFRLSVAKSFRVFTCCTYCWVDSCAVVAKCEKPIELRIVSYQRITLQLS